MDVFVPIVFPDYKISAFGRKWEDLGHAGILFILGSTGLTKYYEYGRYDTNQGEVRKRLVPDAKVDKATNTVTKESLARVLRSISRQAGHGTRISGVHIAKSGGFQKALDYVEGRRKRNQDKSRTGYGILDNNCGTFMKETLEAAGIDTPWMIDPRPSSYIEELRDAFKDLDYDPKSHKLVIGD